MTSDFEKEPNPETVNIGQFCLELGIPGSEDAAQVALAAQEWRQLNGNADVRGTTPFIRIPEEAFTTCQDISDAVAKALDPSREPDQIAPVINIFDRKRQ